MTQTEIQAVADLAAASIKLAHAAEAKAQKAPAPLDPALAEKAAKTLVTTGFVDEGLEKAAADKLKTAAGALEVLESVAVKAAEELARRDGREPNPKLAAGEAIPTSPFKQAEAQTAAATDDWVRRMGQFRRS